MKSNVLTAVEITDSHIKVVQSAVQRASFVVNFCDVRQIPQQSDEAISQTLASMAARIKAEGANIIGVIPRRFTILRHLTLPSHADEEIRKMVDLQVVKQIPYPKEDLVLDYVVLEKEPSGYAKILVIAVHKEVAGRYLKIFRDAGLRLKTLTVSSMGLVSWCLFQQQKMSGRDNEPVMVIDVDVLTTEICFCRGQTLLFSRSINFGLKDLHEEAIAEFFEQILLTAGAYAKEGIGKEIAHVFLISPVNQGHLLKQKLEAEYKIPVRIFSAFDNMTQGKNLGLPVPANSDAASLSVCAGFVAAPPARFVNLLPPEVIDTMQVREEKQKWLKLAGLTFLTLALAVSAFLIRVYKESLYLKELKASIKQVQPQVEKVEEKINQLDFISEKLNPSSSAVDIIYELHKLTPSGVTFSSVYLSEDGALTLQGVAEIGGNVNVLQRSLIGSKLLKNVTLQYATKRKVFKGELTDFKMICQVVQK